VYEKTIKFKLEKKFFNQAGFLDNKYVYDWMNLAKKYMVVHTFVLEWQFEKNI